MATNSAPLLLANGHAWDADARTFRAGMDVLFREGRIAAVGPSLARDAGTHVLDCTGKYVLPGLIDCHVHLTSGGEAGDLTRRDPIAVRAFEAANNARRTLMAGFTTVRDLGAPEQLNIHLARAVEAGTVTGPTILAAGLGVTMTGGHGHGFIAREADGPDEVRKAVREQLRAGAGAIKLFASGGVLTPGVDPRSPSFTEDELRAGVEEAHKAFRVVGAHAQAAEGIKNAIRAGVDSIEHGVWLDEEAIGLMLERGTFLVATLTAPGVMAERGEAEGVAAYAVEKSNLVLADHLASFQAAMGAGVKLAMGTDQGTPLNRPGENGQEIVRLVRAGLSPAAGILAATAWAAGLLQIDAGRLDAGLRGDAVVFASDPITDISVLTRTDQIAAVVHAGDLVRPKPGSEPDSRL
ncbi:MAG: amidohydrolase family protein [Dehalococcoidia bacterium]